MANSTHTIELKMFCKIEEAELIGIPADLDTLS